MHIPLIIAAIPALIGSLFVMSAAGAGRGPMVLQCVAAAVSVLGCLWALGKPAGALKERANLWLLAALAMMLLLPMAAGAGDEPRRWVSLGGFRLYAAACVVPAMLILLGRLCAGDGSARTWGLVAAAMVAAVLAMQPDAPQATAFSLATLWIIIRSGASPVAKGIAILGLAASVFAAWRQPDTLAPVAYVEGVLDVAASGGFVWLASALSCVALVPAAAAWQARSRGEPGLWAVAAYYLTLAGLAYEQLTPMPLLGFGAGPILGYFLMTYLAQRNRCSTMRADRCRSEEGRPESSPSS
ncbi:MAG TPA: hypothetical protein VEC06_00945 [Paucimonas sp.]|nr:hypothetical protein [Paucimonas sp.]